MLARESLASSDNSAIAQMMRASGEQSHEKEHLPDLQSVFYASFFGAISIANN